MSDPNEIISELKRTSSVGAAVRYLLTETRNALFGAGIGNPQKSTPDMDALTSLHALFSRIEDVADAIVHGTPTAENDTDPNAPPKGSNPGSTGNDVYGSLGPTDDTDGAASSQRNRDLSTAGPTHPELQDSPAQPPAHPDSAADLPENQLARQNAGTDGTPPAGAADANQNSMGSGNISAAQQSETRGAAPTSTDPGSVGAPGQSRFEQDTAPGQSTAAHLAQPKEADNQAKAQGGDQPQASSPDGKPKSADGVSDEVPR